MTRESFNQSVDKVVIVDPGKNTVKVLVFSNTYELLDSFCFPSMSKKKRNYYDIDSSSEFQFRLEYNDQKYLVGEGIDGDYNFDITKNNLHHKLCVYSAIARAVCTEGERIHLVVGYPSSDFVNEENRLAYQKMLQDEGTVCVTFNNVEKSFELVRVEVKPEGIALKPRMERFAKQRVRIIDIGGENINIRVYDEKGNTFKSFSLDHVGVNHLVEFIKTRLRRYLAVDKVDIEAIDYMRGVREGQLIEVLEDDIANYANSKEFMEDVVTDFVESVILANLKSKGVNLNQRGDNDIFTGGGSALLEKYIKRAIPNNRDCIFFSKTAVWDNCISYAIKDVGDRCKLASGDRGTNLKIAQALANTILNETNVLKM